MNSLKVVYSSALLLVVWSILEFVIVIWDSHTESYYRPRLKWYTQVFLSYAANLLTIDHESQYYAPDWIDYIYTQMYYIVDTFKVKTIQTGITDRFQVL